MDPDTYHKIVVGKKGLVPKEDILVNISLKAPRLFLWMMMFKI